MTQITIAALIERLTNVDGDRARAQRQLAEALDTLGMPVRATYTPPEVMHIAVAIGRAQQKLAEALPPGESRELLLEVLPALDDLEAFANTVPA